MKTCDEMVESLLTRRDKYIVEKRRRKNAILGVLSLCCVCFVSVLGLRAYGRTELPVDTNKIIVHSVDTVSLDKYIPALMLKDHIEMDHDEVIEYYGTNVFPTVPNDLIAKDINHGIYRRNNGTGEVYWDLFNMEYCNEDFSRYVSVKAQGIDGIPKVLESHYFLEPTEEMSMINDVEVAIGVDRNYHYQYAQFEYKDVYFLIVADGLELEEFIDVIISLLK